MWGRTWEAPVEAGGLPEVVKMSTATEVKSVAEIVAEVTAERLPIQAIETGSDLRKRKGRSRVTNHQDLLPGVKGTSSAARRFRDLVVAYVADMGGLDQCSEIKIGLLRRLAATTVQAEMLEARMVNGEAVDVSTLCTLASTAMRLSSRLGLERQAKPVETLHEYLSRRYPDGGRGEDGAADNIEEVAQP
jgi:hypothetical protein